MRHQGNQVLSRCNLGLDLPLEKVRGTTPKSGISSKNVHVRNCRVEYTENDMGVLEHVYMSTYARHGGWLSGRGAQGASPYFGIGQLNVLFSRTFRPIRIKFGSKHRGNLCFTCGSTSPKEVGDNIDPTSRKTPMI